MSQPTTTEAFEKTGEVLIRAATADDSAALRRLAQLDSRRLGDGPFLVAEVGGELRAALSRGDGSLVADPFAATAELGTLLSLRASQLPRPGAEGERDPTTGRGSRIPRIFAPAALR